MKTMIALLALLCVLGAEAAQAGSKRGVAASQGRSTATSTYHDHR
jgi:hypothetical protein